MRKTLAVAGLDYRHVVFVNPYQTDKVMRVMNRIYAIHFEFDNTPARATIRMNSLPLGANIEFTAVAVRDLSKRRAVRPKNMSPGPTASPCVRGDDAITARRNQLLFPDRFSGCEADSYHSGAGSACTQSRPGER